jgi:hypothetical protein
MLKTRTMESTGGLIQLPRCTMILAGIVLLFAACRHQAATGPGTSPIQQNGSSLNNMNDGKGEMRFTELVPGSRLFMTLSDVYTTFPTINLPQLLPAGAEFMSAEWVYPPVPISQEIEGVVRIVGYEYDIPPSLELGRVTVTYGVKGGLLMVSQESAKQGEQRLLLGIYTVRQSPKGRTFYVRELGGGRLRKVEWNSQAGHRLIIASTVLSFEELVEILDSVPES